MKLKELVEQYGEYDVGLIETPKGQESEWARVHLFKPKPKSVWDLGKGDSHVIVDECGKIREYGDWVNCLAEKNIRDIGNVFLTREDAEKDVERRKVESLLLKHGGRRWARKDVNYRLGLQYNMVVICKDMYPLQGAIYFDLEQEAQKAIDEIGEDRIKRALFEVK